MIHYSAHHVVIYNRWRIHIVLAAIIFSISCHALAFTILAIIPVSVFHRVDSRASLQFEVGDSAILMDINPVPVVEVPQSPSPSTVADEPQRELTAYLDATVDDDSDDGIAVESRPILAPADDSFISPTSVPTSRRTTSRTMNYAADRVRFWSAQFSELVQNLRDQIRKQQLETVMHPLPSDEADARSVDSQAGKELSQSPTADQPAGETKTRQSSQVKDNDKDKPRQVTSSPSPVAPGVRGSTVSVKVMRNPAPQYPALSRRLNEEGLVVLKIQVRVDGSIGKIVVLEEPGYPRLVKAALDAVEKSVFQPALNNGKPVEDTIVLRFRFKLTDDL